MTLARNSALAVSCIAFSLSASNAFAQAPVVPTANFTNTSADSGFAGRPRNFLKHFAVGAWVGQSVSARTASHNESISGGMTMLALRIEREIKITLPVGFRVSYVGEFLPMLLVTSEAPPGRIPGPVTPGGPTPDRSLYARRRSYGVGISPLGAEFVRRINKTFSTAVGATVGGEWFSNVVPYGSATRANFTVTSGIEVRWQAGSKSIMTLGYKLHHLSNASLGGSNPGLNAHLVSVSVMRTR